MTKVKQRGSAADEGKMDKNKKNSSKLSEVKKKPLGSFISRFMTGLLVIIPLFFSVAIVLWLMNKFDSILEPIVTSYIGVKIPGLGIVALVCFIWLVGLAAGNYFGRQFVNFYESILAKIPVLNFFFNAIKQISDSLLDGNKNTFHKTVLVKSWMKDTYILGFITSETVTKLKLRGKTLLGVHVITPTPPNPVSGFVMFTSPKNIIPLDISIEEGLKLAVSMGVLHPAEYREESRKKR